MNLLTKIIFRFKKTKIIVIFGKIKETAGQEIYRTIKPFLKVKKIINNIPNLFDIIKNDVLIFETDFASKFFLKIIKLAKISRSPILVVTRLGDLSADSDFSSESENELKKINEAVKLMPIYSFLVLNADDKLSRKIEGTINFRKFTFGFKDRADFKASDVRVIEDGMNFKINYDGKIIPIWQKGVSGEDAVCACLVAGCVGVILGLNFVEISEALKH